MRWERIKMANVLGIILLTVLMSTLILMFATPINGSLDRSADNIKSAFTTANADLHDSSYKNDGQADLVGTSDGDLPDLTGGALVSPPLLVQSNYVVFDLELYQALDIADYFNADSSVDSFTFAPGGQWAPGGFIPQFYTIATQSTAGTSNEFGIRFTAPSTWQTSYENLKKYTVGANATLQALPDGEFSALHTVPAETYLTLNSGATTTENIDITVQYIGENDGATAVPGETGFSEFNTIPVPASGSPILVDLDDKWIDPDIGGSLTFTFNSHMLRINNSWDPPTSTMPSYISFVPMTAELTVDAGSILQSNHLHRIRWDWTDNYGDTGIKYLYLSQE